MTNQQGVPEALRLADALEFRTTSWPDKVFAAAELRRLHALTEIQQQELISESHRTAEQKLRADQMTRQHADQAAMNREARAKLAALVEAQQPAPSAAGDVFDEPDEVIKLRALAATCYAGLGAECNLPENWLDALNAAANGEPFTTSGLLPYKAQPSPTPQADSQPAPATQQARKSVAIQWLAEMIMSDCGCSTQNQRLLDRIIERITQYERANTSTQSEGAQAPMIDAEATAYNEWFNGEQGTAYYGMWEFARAAWMARAARAPADSVLEDAALGIDAAFEAVRRGLCKLPRYSFYIDTGGGVRKVGDRIGKWIEFDEAHALFDPISVDAARKQGATHD